MTQTSFQPNRREFLGAVSSSALCFPLAGSRPVFGVGANEQIRIGHIGVRNRGTENLKALMEHTVALCDVDSKVMAKAKRLADRRLRSPCAVFSDYRKMLEDKNIDAVVITTPDHWHALMTIHACQSGKDVYCEKPLTLTVKEGGRMVEAARKYGRIVQTGSQQRSDAHFQIACELVKSGGIGKLKSIEIGLPGPKERGPMPPDSSPPPELDYDFWLGPAPDRPYNPRRVHYEFRWFWDYSGGQLTNWGAHHLDIAQWAMDMDNSGPVAIDGQARYHAENWYEVPRWFDVYFRYANGVKLRCGRECRSGVTFFGESGRIHVNRGRLSSRPGSIVRTALKDQRERLNSTASHYENWLSCIRDRTQPICDVSIGHRSATVCHLGNISMRLGRPIEWNPETEEIINDSEAAAMLDKPYRAPWKLS